MMGTRTEQLDDDFLTTVLDRVGAVTGEPDPDARVALVQGALAEPINLHGSPDAATILAKAATAAPTMPATARLGLGLAEVEMLSRLEPLEHLAKNTGGSVPPEKLAEARSDLACVALAKTLKPLPPNPAEYVDRRPELTALRDRARSNGDEGAAQTWSAALAIEEAKAATRTPSASIPWGGARPFVPAAEEVQL
jgi:hypothetical protein